MNLHDWIDEACDVLDLEIELDEALVLELARVVAHNVVRPAAPVTAFLLGYAAAAKGAKPQEVEELATSLEELAERWDRPASNTADSGSDPDDEELEEEGVSAAE